MPTLLLMLALLALSTIQLVPVNAATVQNCNAPAGSQCTLTFNLNNGDKVSGSVSITGGGANDVDFFVTNPSGAQIYNAGRVNSGTSFSFTADASGAYILHFDNSFSLLSDKMVTVSYDVSSGGGGIPEFPPSQVLIATVVVLLVAISYLVVRQRNHP
ncbi:MAG TPA: emp24/gp25L/p24 family protein [Nitrososphaerales archaeon]|nr:emp24/gp25L/p24 family protein [Nitrososphaerales archaeon]